MAKAKTAAYDKITLGVEFDPDGSPGVFDTICGITSWSYEESTNLDETEVPDCEDLSKPLDVERAVRSVGATASCEGVWALSSHQKILAWARSGQTLNVEVRFGTVTDDGAATDTEALTGPALMTNRRLQAQYGQKMQNSFSLVFDGLPVPTLKGT